MATKKTTNRRRFLKTVGAAGGIGMSSISGCLSMWIGGDNGGGKYPSMEFASQKHRVTREMATQVVSDRASLLEAVRTPEATVWIPNSVTIDMTGVIGAPIAPNVTIASGRNLNDKNGGQIKTDGYDKGIFINDAGGCRITGLRLRGPRLDKFEPWQGNKDEEDFAALGFNFQGQTAIIDHCEVFGWTFAGIALGAETKYTQGWIHHNSMHHNQMNHLGYPMELYNGLHLIEWNTFDYNRHSIAGFGYPTSGYEARFNVIGPNATLHAFDMHYLGENLDYLKGSKLGTVAGTFVNIHHNVFKLTSYPAFSIQGYPEEYARFCNNWCAEQIDGGEPDAIGKVVLFPNKADVRVKGNTYGSSAVLSGQERLREIELQVAESQNSSTDDPPKATPTPMNLKQLFQGSTQNESTTQ
ncbi:hypothetical protein [Halocatena pleomorpha]|uniref:Twin-arginine translocation signal domain-containing protein n=1 Tax=Halocatena pleomorpha TaxID=1785090 RepID=A0A3P3RJP7_9EURY|nr:hypothetical protein [Halocatena pleomorpha]RRJ33632.1 hypothetical protein EIK79_02205 [Halocatena pleomorpha]